MKLFHQTTEHLELDDYLTTSVLVYFCYDFLFIPKGVR